MSKNKTVNINQEVINIMDNKTITSIEGWLTDEAGSYNCPFNEKCWVCHSIFINIQLRSFYNSAFNWSKCPCATYSYELVREVITESLKIRTANEQNSKQSLIKGVKKK